MQSEVCRLGTMVMVTSPEEISWSRNFEITCE